MTGPQGEEDRRLLAADELNRLVRRLRTLTPRAWAARRGAVRTSVDELARLALLAERLPPRPVPELPDHALADAVAVLAADALEALAATPDPGILDQVLGTLRAALDATR